jgi:hypothetical protein
MKVIRECSPEEPFKSGHLWRSTLHFWSIKEISEAKWWIIVSKLQP